MGEVSEEVEGLESRKRGQERRGWGGDKAPCGAPAVIRVLVGSDSWVGGAQSLQWGVAFGKGAPTGVFCGPWDQTLDRQG